MEEELQRFINHELLNDLGNVDVDQELLISGVIDSMGVMRLVRYLDDDFHITIPFEDITLTNFTSIRRLADYIKAKHPGAGPA